MFTFLAKIAQFIFSGTEVKGIVGKLFSMIPSVVIMVERLGGSGAGPAKLDAARAAVNTSVAELNLEIKDKARFQQGVDKLVAGIVDILHATGEFK